MKERIVKLKDYFVSLLVVILFSRMEFGGGDDVLYVFEWFESSDNGVTGNRRFDLIWFQKTPPNYIQGIKYK